MPQAWAAFTEIFGWLTGACVISAIIVANSKSELRKVQNSNIWHEWEAYTTQDMLWNIIRGTGLASVTIAG